MDAELIERIRLVADEWERDAPALSLAEVVAPRTPAELQVSPPDVVVLEPLHRRPRWWMVAGAAAATVAMVAATAALLGRTDSHTAVPPPDSDVAVSTDAPTTSASPTSTVASSVEAMFATMLDEVTAARAALDGFTATVTVTSSNPGIDATGAPLPPDVVTHTDRVVMLADGRMWSEGDLFLWGSFDPSTGTARNATLGPDGAVQYQEVVGWADNSVGINIVFGTDPLADVYGLSLMGQAPHSTMRIERVTSRLGRDAWRVTQSMTSPSSDESNSDTTTETTWDIDRDTGIVVEYHDLQSYNGAEQRTDVEITELSTDAELPPEFPGSFPDGAAVNRSGDPNAFAPMSVADAAAAFGGPLYVPTGFGNDATAFSTTQRQAWGSTVENSTMHQVEIRHRKGFTTESVTVFEYVLDPGEPVPDGTRLVDGRICPATSGPCGGVADGSSVITGGALAGAPSATEGNVVSGALGAVTFVVRAGTPSTALALANSLELVLPPQA